MTPHLQAASPVYAPHDPSQTLLYQVVADHLETFLASLDADPDARGLPAYVERAFYDYLQCGVLAHGFLRLGCDTCHKELLLAFSCKKRGFCPSCAGRRMAQTAAHLVERVLPWVPTGQWVVSVPVPLRYWMAAPRMHLVRYGGCLAPHSHLRGAIIPTPRQQGVDEEATDTVSPRWSWARLLKLVFALDMARSPFCQQGTLRLIAAITQGEVIRK